MKYFKSSTALKLSRIACLSIALGFAIATLSAKEEQTNSTPQTVQGDFAKGAALWAKTCLRCHNMRDPQELDDKQWKAVMTHMRLRAGLTGKDTRDILAFLRQSNGK